MEKHPFFKPVACIAAEKRTCLDLRMWVTVTLHRTSVPADELNSQDVKRDTGQLKHNKQKNSWQI